LDLSKIAQAPLSRIIFHCTYTFFFTGIEAGKVAINPQTTDLTDLIQPTELQPQMETEIAQINDQNFHGRNLITTDPVALIKEVFANLFI